MSGGVLRGVQNLIQIRDLHIIDVHLCTGTYEKADGITHEGFEFEDVVIGFIYIEVVKITRFADGDFIETIGIEAGDFVSGRNAYRPIPNDSGPFSIEAEEIEIAAIIATPLEHAGSCTGYNFDAGFYFEITSLIYNLISLDKNT